MTQTSAVLLDKTPAPLSLEALKQDIEADGNIKVEGLHLWTLSEGHNAVILSVRTNEGQYHKSAEVLRHHLPRASHIPVEMS